MLDVDFEFKKGMLFIRLEGNLTKKTVKKLDYEVTDMIKENGIKNVLFNLNDLQTIDIKGINRLFYNYELCKKIGGISLLCCPTNQLAKKRIKNSRLLNYMLETKDEISAFDYI